ncbi:MAG: hypothetical protein AB2L20_11675 [Mangrovibacterium sp.]
MNENASKAGDTDLLVDKSFDIYKKYYLRAVLLEIFGKGSPLNDTEIKNWIFDEVKRENDIFHKTTMLEVVNEYHYLMKIGYLKEAEGDKKITLSEYGINALRECVFQNLASSAFFGHKSIVLSNYGLKVAKSALTYSKIAALGAIVSVFFSLISIVLSIYK